MTLDQAELNQRIIRLEQDNVDLALALAETIGSLEFLFHERRRPTKMIADVAGHRLRMAKAALAKASGKTP